MPAVFALACSFVIWSAAAISVSRMFLVCGSRSLRVARATVDMQLHS